MSNEKILVVGVCTYKRPAALQCCLDSIIKQDPPTDVRIIIMVADNDSQGTARDVVQNVAKNAKFQIEYAIEKGRGIPFARNNILRRALAVGASEIAFIDDDETAKPKWIATLWKYYKESSVDVVRGYVRTQYPPGTPLWIIRGGFYQRIDYPEGTTFDSANTGNVLFNIKKIVEEWNCWFDENLGLRGGEDSDFFRRAFSKGAKISWASGAIVEESLDESRYSISYLLKRKFRTRNSEAYFRNLNIFRRIIVFSRSLWKILLGIIILPVSPLFGSHVAVKALCRIVEGSGRILGLFGAHIGWDEYHGE